MANTKMPLNKQNYIFIIAGCAVVLLGFMLMSGGGSEDPNIHNEAEMFSDRRITLAPFTVMIGYGLVLFGILKRPKQETLLSSENLKEIKNSTVIDTPKKAS